MSGRSCGHSRSHLEALPAPYVALRETVIVLTALLMSVVVLASPAYAASDKERHKQITNSMKDLKADINDTSADLAKASKKLAAVRQELAAAQAVVDRAQAQVDAAVEREKELLARQQAVRARELAAQQQLVAVETQMGATQDQINSLASAAYQRGRLSDVAIYLEAQSPEDLTSQMAYTESAANSEDALLTRLEGERAAVDARRAELATTRQELGQLRQQAQQTTQAKQQAATQARDARNQVAKLVAQARAAKAELLRQKAAEQARLATLAKEAKELEWKLAARSAPGGGGFKVAASGSFMRPVWSPVTSSFGYRIHPIFGYRKFHDGTDFGGGCGTPIHAAASGRVLDKGYYNGWGNRVVIEHGVKSGKSISTAYNHMSSAAVYPGQVVSKGQVVGYIGSTGYSTGCHLHFNFYVNGSPTNPMAWVA